MVVGPGVISNSRIFGRSFGVSQMIFFSGIESSAGFPNITSRVNIDKGTFRTRKTLEAWNTKMTPNTDNNSSLLPGQYNIF